MASSGRLDCNNHVAFALLPSHQFLNHQVATSCSNSRPRQRQFWKACSIRDNASVKPNSTILSWNVNSLRSLLRKDPETLQKLVEQYRPDLLCLQETKLQVQHEKLFSCILKELPFVIFNSSRTRLGYSGTAIYAKEGPRFVQLDVKHEIGDDEGRVVSFNFPGICVVNVYTINSGSDLQRLPTRLSWDKAFRRFIRELRSTTGKPVIVVGDFNVAHRDLDVYDPTKLRGLPGFSSQERTSFDDLLETAGLVDAFRLLHPQDSDRFTYWDYRTYARKDNRGWRIDYILVSDDMVDAVRDVRILDQVPGSDHCPLAIEIAPGFLN